MAHHQSAIKRIRQTRTRKIFNRQYKKLVKMSIRTVRESTTFDEAVENFRKATSILDRISAKKIMHKNAVANRKSSLAKYVYSLKENA